MKLLLIAASFMMFAVPVWAVAPAVHGPKNLMSPTYRPPAVQAVVPHEMTKREAKRLTRTAESAADHLKLARYYRAAADKFDANGAGYEKAAAKYRHGLRVKNLMAPTTPGRYEFFAKGFREKARTNSALAASHEEMARVASAGR
jgi:hypothetical protein